MWHFFFKHGRKAARMLSILLRAILHAYNRFDAARDGIGKTAQDFPFYISPLADNSGLQLIYIGELAGIHVHTKTEHFPEVLDGVQVGAARRPRQNYDSVMAKVAVGEERIMYRCIILQVDPANAVRLGSGRYKSFLHDIDVLLCVYAPVQKTIADLPKYKKHAHTINDPPPICCLYNIRLSSFCMSGQ